MKKILIAGQAGQVGWALQQTVPHDQYAVIAPTEAVFDITDYDAIHHILDQYKPDWLINAAAYTAVDKAETEQETNFRVNAIGSKLLAEACSHYHIPLFHFSTDYVFDGKQLDAYKETDIPHPINEYGKAKLAGEVAIQEALAEHLILRVSGVFCEHGHNFVKTMLRLFQEKEKLDIVDDQITCPTSAMDIAKTVWKIIANINNTQQGWGTYHYCSTPPVSWFQFAEDILKEAATKTTVVTKTLNKISSMQFNAPAERLKNAVLNCDKIKKIFNIDQPSWQIAIRELIGKLL